MTSSLARSTAVTGNVFIAKASSYIRDAAGSIRYIVDLVDDDPRKPESFADAESLIDHRKKRSAALIDDAIKLRGIELFATTSLIGPSFTAYLTEKQVDQLSKDKRVKLITQDAYLKPSALWNSSTDYDGQVRPWGLYATSVAQAGSSNGSTTVYVLDTGVEPHGDLPGLERISAISGVPLTGCYAHSTHVAGIVGAADNSAGVVGVFPGVKIVSVGTGDGAVGACSNGYSVSGFTTGLDIIFGRVINSRLAAVVNISFNGAAGGIFSPTGTIGSKMKTVATPFDGGFNTVLYKGAFIAQSAGNQLEDACTWAYSGTSASDGIMVVGGLDDNGQRVVPLTGPSSDGTSYGFISFPAGSDEVGSNTGPCVEVWAPSQRVKSTWSNGSYAFLSGTSMAAPHIAGLAARLLASNPNMTSVGVEAAVRARVVTVAGSNLGIAQLTAQNNVAAPSVDIYESGDRASVAPINFSKYASQIDLRLGAFGASYCAIYVTQNGNYYNNYYLVPAPTVNLNAAALPAGAQYVWDVTCFSPQGIATNVVARGFVKRVVSQAWQVRTTSTGGGWQNLSSGALVTWALGGSFEQNYFSSGADYCQVQSFGFRGNIANDREKPGNPGYDVFPPAFSQTLLWDSGPFFPTSYPFGTFYLGNPNTAAPPLGPYDGYKWRLACRNWEGDSKVSVMYGQLQ